MDGSFSFNEVRNDIENRLKNGLKNPQEIGVKLDGLKTNRLYLGRVEIGSESIKIRKKKHSYKRSLVGTLPEEIADLELLENAKHPLLDKNFIENLYKKNSEDGTGVFMDYHISRRDNFSAVCIYPQVSTPHEERVLCSDLENYNPRKEKAILDVSYIYVPRDSQKFFLKGEKMYESHDLKNFKELSNRINGFLMKKEIKSQSY